MSRSERRAYLLAIAARYAVAQRAQKGRMLDEYCATVQVSRKHAIARIGRAIKALADEAAGILRAPRQRTGRSPLYAADRDLFAAIHTIWESHHRNLLESFRLRARAYWPALRAGRCLSSSPHESPSPHALCSPQRSSAVRGRCRASCRSHLRKSGYR